MEQQDCSAVLPQFGGRILVRRLWEKTNAVAYMSPVRYRLIDTAGGEIGFINDSRPVIHLGDRVKLPDGTPGTVVDVYDDEDGKEGNVQANLAVEE